MRTYRDFCRPAHPVERTAKHPGDLVLHAASVERVPGEERVVPMKRGRRSNG